jgi:hypothetical protein
VERRRRSPPRNASRGPGRRSSPAPGRQSSPSTARSGVRTSAHRRRGQRRDRDAARSPRSPCSGRAARAGQGRLASHAARARRRRGRPHAARERDPRGRGRSAALQTGVPGRLTQIRVVRGLHQGMGRRQLRTVRRSVSPRMEPQVARSVGLAGTDRGACPRSRARVLRRGVRGVGTSRRTVRARLPAATPPKAADETFRAAALPVARPPPRRASGHSALRLRRVPELHEGRGRVLPTQGRRDGRILTRDLRLRREERAVLEVRLLTGPEARNGQADALSARARRT